MVLEKPTQASDLRYFTKKSLPNNGKVTIWVFTPKCPKCGAGRLVIPYDEEAGRYKSRAKSFTCNNCKFEVLKPEIKAETPIANIEYICPYCGKSGEKQAPFNRMSSGAFKFTCDYCGKEIKAESSKKKPAT